MAGAEPEEDGLAERDAQAEWGHGGPGMHGRGGRRAPRRNGPGGVPTQELQAGRLDWIAGAVPEGPMESEESRSGVEPEAELGEDRGDRPEE